MVGKRSTDHGRHFGKIYQKVKKVKAYLLESINSSSKN